MTNIKNSFYYVPMVGYTLYKESNYKDHDIWCQLYWLLVMGLEETVQIAVDIK